MLSTRVVANLLTDNAFLGTVAVGRTFVILSGEIDLSVGSVTAFIVTLAGMFLARGAAYVLSTESVPIGHEFYDTLQSPYWKAPGGGRLR